MSEIKQFCTLIRNRSLENKKSFDLLYKEKCVSNCISIVRQELDSIIRVIYLLQLKDEIRNCLINQTLNGEKWVYINLDGSHV